MLNRKQFGQDVVNKYQIKRIHEYQRMHKNINLNSIFLEYYNGCQKLFRKIYHETQRLLVL